MNFELPMLKLLARTRMDEGEVIDFKTRKKVDTKKEEPSKSREVATREKEITPITRIVKEKDVKAALRGAEGKLDHEARYKQWDVYEDEKTVYWVTQETYSPEMKKAAARTLARMLKNADITGWTVKVTVRDDFAGYGKYEAKESKWQTAKS